MSDLQDVEERFRILIDGVRDYAIFMLDPDGRVLSWSEGARRLLGYTADEAVGLPIACLYLPEDVEAGLPDRHLQTARAEGHVEEEVWLVRKDGSRFWANGVTTTLRKDGKISGYARVLRDLTERKRAEIELRRLQEEQQIIFHSVPAMIWYKDAHNRIIRANRAAAASMGLTVEAIEGRSTYDLYPREDAEAYFADDLEVIRTGQPRLGILEPYQHATGERVWVRTDKLPYRDENGNVNGVIVFSVDVTALKRTEEALEAAHQRLLSTEVEKKRFYGEVIRAVTRDKLQLVEPGEILTVGAQRLAVPLQNPESYAEFRRELRRLSQEAGLSEGAAEDLVVASGEAATNAIKHAVGGRAAVFILDDRVTVRVTDAGPGIHPENLPSSILRPGFSTKVSLGMGFTLMLELVERLWLASGPEGTIVQLEKWAHPPVEEDPTLAALLDRF